MTSENSPDPVGHVVKLEPELLKLMPNLPKELDLMNAIAKSPNRAHALKMTSELLLEMEKNLPEI